MYTENTCQLRFGNVNYSFYICGVTKWFNMSFCHLIGSVNSYKRYSYERTCTTHYRNNAG